MSARQEHDYLTMSSCSAAQLISSSFDGAKPLQQQRNLSQPPSHSAAFIFIFLVSAGCLSFAAFICAIALRYGRDHYLRWKCIFRPRKSVLRRPLAWRNFLDDAGHTLSQPTHTLRMHFSTPRLPPAAALFAAHTSNGLMNIKTDREISIHIHKHIK